MTQHGPWRIKESIEKYKNKWITVTEHQVIRPDGKDGIFGVVNMLAGVSVLPLDNEQNILITKEFRFAINKESIEAISGGIEDNEDPLTAAKRELLEESGFEARLWTPLGTVHPFTSVIHSAATLFLAEDLRDTGETNHEGTEQIEIIKMPFTQAVEMVLSGEIVHGPTCILILKAHQYLKRRKMPAM